MAKDNNFICNVCRCGRLKKNGEWVKIKITLSDFFKTLLQLPKNNEQCVIDIAVVVGQCDKCSGKCI